MAIQTATAVTKTGQSASNSKQFRMVFDRVIPARVTFDHNSLASGTSAAGVYTITGAVVGDFVLVAVQADLGDDIIFTAQVTATDEVTVIATDASAATNTSAATAVDVNLLVLGASAGLFDNAGSF